MLRWIAAVVQANKELKKQQKENDIVDEKIVFSVIAGIVWAAAILFITRVLIGVGLYFLYTYWYGDRVKEYIFSYL